MTRLMSSERFSVLVVPPFYPFLGVEKSCDSFHLISFLKKKKRKCHSVNTRLSSLLLFLPSCLVSMCDRCRERVRDRHPKCAAISVFYKPPPVSCFNSKSRSIQKRFFSFSFISFPPRMFPPVAQKENQEKDKALSLFLSLFPVDSTVCVCGYATILLIACQLSGYSLAFAVNPIKRQVPSIVSFDFDFHFPIFFFALALARDAESTSRITTNFERKKENSHLPCVCVCVWKGTGDGRLHFRERARARAPALTYKVKLAATNSPLCGKREESFCPSASLTRP